MWRSMKIENFILENKIEIILSYQAKQSPGAFRVEGTTSNQVIWICILASGRKFQ